MLWESAGVEDVHSRAAFDEISRIYNLWSAITFKVALLSINHSDMKIICSLMDPPWTQQITNKRNILTFFFRQMHIFIYICIKIPLTSSQSVFSAMWMKVFPLKLGWAMFFGITGWKFHYNLSACCSSGHLRRLVLLGCFQALEYLARDG